MVFENINLTGKVIAVKCNELTGEKSFYEGHNIVTNSGDAYYAVLAAEEAASFTVSGIRLGDSNGTTGKSSTDVDNFLAGTGKATENGYPKTNDDDGDNTGAGVDVVTWKYAWTTAQGNASGIYEGAIVDDLVTPLIALTHFDFASAFNKTGSDTLKVFVNHTFNGT